MKPVRAVLALALVALAFGGCDNMQHQANPRPLEESRRFPGQSSARHPPAHTVARDAPDPASPFASGRDARGGYVKTLPVPLTLPLLQRGRERFNIYCAPCHGADGYGRGIVVRRGFPAPPSLHEAAQRALPDGRVFAVITAGAGKMLGLADRLAPDERWAVVAYVRALQRGQHATLADVPPARRAALKTP